MCAVNLKVDQLEAELQDLNSQESKDEASLAKVFQNIAIHFLCTVTFIFAGICKFICFACCLKMRKQLRDMEAKVKDQEEELDEQAGNIQMLEQVLSPVTLLKV